MEDTTVVTTSVVFGSLLSTGAMVVMLNGVCVLILMTLVMGEGEGEGKREKPRCR